MTENVVDTIIRAMQAQADAYDEVFMFNQAREIREQIAWLRRTRPLEHESAPAS
ncbi:hypothetical protein ACDA63_13355 [Uliginosibacterium sp. sgz301328]|uniref:hypothetical protein n=1 Tax=Uliginosibacterium sp. sgz301328 TaxID=3243764 RepID=UPI00359EC964